MRQKAFRLLPLLAAFLVTTLAPFRGSGQETAASLKGRVTDPSEAAIPGVSVEIRNIGTNQVTPVKTDALGNYSVPYLLPGSYSISAEASGFKKFVQTGLVLNVAQAATVDIKLELGTINEEVSVNAQALMLDVANADRGNVMDTTAVNELPLNGRNPYMLSRLAAGVTFNGSAIYQRPFDNGNSSGIAAWSVNGSLTGTNEFLLDGAPNDAQAGYNDVAVVPAVDAVQEFKMQSNSYDAQYGHTMGGIMNVTTKAGTNTLHGTAYEFLRRQWLDANSFTNNAQGTPRPDHFLDQYGGEIDGPFYLPKIYDGRNKSFFTVAFENYREGTPTTGSLSVPEPEMRMGDFSKLVDGDGNPILIYDPATGHNVGGTWTRTPFAGNILPSNRINPIAQKILGYMPMPNIVTPGVNYSQSNYFYSPAAKDAAYPNGGDPNLYLDRDNFYNLLIRLDHQFGDRNHIYFRHASSDRTEMANTSDGAVGPGENNSRPEKRINEAYAIDWVGIVSSQTVINLRFSFSSYYDADRGDGNAGFDMTKLGFPASTVKQLPGDAFFGEYDFSNYDSLGEYPRWNWTHTGSPQFQISHMRGNHSMRAGADLRWIAYEANGAAGSALALSSSPMWTQANYANSDGVSGDDIASWLLGTPDGGSSQYDAATANMYRYFAPWAQDDWRVNKRLTLNLGVRWDFNMPATERYNRLDRGFDFNAVNPVNALIAPGSLPTVMGGILFAGVNGQPRSAADTYKRAIQPRIGFAYQATSKLVARGGFGLFYSNPSNNYLQTIGFNTSTPVVSSLDGDRTPITNLIDNPFPQGIAAPTGSSLGALTFVGQGLNAGSGYFVPAQGIVNQNFKLPRTEEFSLGFQYEMPYHGRLEASYVGNRSTNLESTTAVNYNPLSLRQQCNQIEGGTPGYCDQLVTNPFYGLAPFSGTSYYTAPTLSRATLTVPYPEFGGINQLMGNYNKSWYNSLQVVYQQRVSNGLNIVANYTLSKFIYQNGFSDIQKQIPERSVYSGDRTHNVTIGTVWSLPFGKGRNLLNSSSRLVNALVGGWENTVMFTYFSGAPWAMPSGVIYVKNANIPINWSAPVVQGLEPCVAKWNDNGTIAMQSYSKKYGCSSYDFLISPRYAPSYGASYDAQRRLYAVPQVDFSLNKTTRINERMRVQFRGEVFNLTNTYLFTTRFGNNVNSSSFGTIVKATSGGGHPRQAQLALKFLF